MDIPFSVDKDSQFQCYNGRKIFHRFESCMRSSLLFGITNFRSRVCIRSDMIYEWLLFLWQWVKKLQGNGAQSLFSRWKSTVQLKRLPGMNDFSFLEPLLFSKKEKKSILELFETKLIFFPSVLCLYPVPFLWHSFKTLFSFVGISSPLMCYVYIV